MKYVILVFTSLLLTSCSFGQESEIQIGYREFSLYRELDGSFPVEYESDIPNEFKCVEDYDSLVAKNAKGEGMWLDYELIYGEEYKKLKVNSEYDMLLDQTQATEDDKVEELNVRFLCAAPGLPLNGELEKMFSNYDASKQKEKDFDFDLEE